MNIMFQDVCFPKNNEEEFVEIAKKLGTGCLIFVYEFINFKDLDEKRKKLSEINDIKVDIGVLVNDKTVEKLQKSDDYVFARTPSKNLIESKKTYILFDFEMQDKPDFLHHRNSGLNQVIANAMKEKILGISFSTYLNSINKGVMLGRMKQNVKIAKKYGVKTFILSFAKHPYELRAKHEIDSFGKMINI